ncbi:conserved hypothetical protein [Pyrobaculum islandicum DSM 4184]|uniref:DNA-(apurinic or apyrimidinic site) lyase n=1 Tax=Pyrobaculum islandicum (strain DSM 4184 / JCM 9189 / GEO3) TaxID=384616 RepID=A1RSU7_PYRIL|nr:N-glycosylase/DNA lyase [Pyrobaculum islandicum]ABL88029.1 conserved hypothetical protein [Pyrobaculum islandicum DSM 4184]
MGEKQEFKQLVDTLVKYIDVILQLEKRDPQYHAVCRVVQNNDELTAARLTMLNALVSYRLTGRGEEHWEYFGWYFSRRVKDVCDDFLKYIETSPYLKIGIETRKKRVAKACGYVPKLEDLEKTLNDLSVLLNAKREQKTLVFAIKMLNYVYMCSRGVNRLLPFNIPIPVDYRIAYLTWCAKLIDIPPKEAIRRYKEVQGIWNKVAEKVGIPPLHLDTLLWLAGRTVIYGENIHGIPQEIIAVFQKREDCTPLSKSRGEISEE